MKAFIRRANLNDLDSIENCINRAFKQYIPLLGKKPSSMNTDFNPIIQNGWVFVTEFESKIVALMVLRKEIDHIELRSVAVDPHFQNRGFGKQILDFVEKKTLDAGFSEIRLYTSARLPRLIEYWNNLGFEETGRRTEGGYYRVFMSKML